MEMIRLVSEASSRSSSYNHSHSQLKQYKHSHHDDHMEDVFGRDIEIDDHSSGAGEWEKLEGMDKMDVDEEEGNSRLKGPLDDAVKYAQQLRVDFKADTRPEIQKALEESFSLVAYPDPKNSVLSHLFDEDGRVAVAEELNSAILGKLLLYLLYRRKAWSDTFGNSLFRQILYRSPGKASATSDRPSTGTQ